MSELKYPYMKPTLILDKWGDPIYAIGTTGELLREDDEGYADRWDWTEFAEEDLIPMFRAMTPLIWNIDVIPEDKRQSGKWFIVESHDRELLTLYCGGDETAARNAVNAAISTEGVL